MCGRFALFTHPEDIERFYDLEYPISFEPKKMIFPTERIGVILPGKKWSLAPWGVEVSWTSQKLINARGETIDEKPTFKESFLHSRCVIPASGFYEWKEGEKNPYFIAPKKGFFSFAGLITHEAATIITTEACAQVEAIHLRTPVCLNREEVNLWLNRRADPAALKNLLHPIKEELTIQNSP